MLRCYVIDNNNIMMEWLIFIGVSLGKIIVLLVSFVKLVR